MLLARSVGYLGPALAFIVWWIQPIRRSSTGCSLRPSTSIWGYILIVVGILLDIASHGGGLWRNRKRVPGMAT